MVVRKVVLMVGLMAVMMAGRKDDPLVEMLAFCVLVAMMVGHLGVRMVGHLVVRMVGHLVVMMVVMTVVLMVDQLV